MAQRIYECNACGYIFHADDTAGAPAMCPICRSIMSDAGEAGESSGATYTCPECEYSFLVPDGGDSAYKCAACNYTFPSEPNKRVDHKL